jgi:hypothetical protein
MAAIFFLLRSIRSERKKIAAFPKLIEAMTIIVPKNDDREPHDSDKHKERNKNEIVKEDD